MAAANGRFSRQPLAGNRIPASRIDPAARNILKYFPEPNTTGTADGQNNYARTRQDKQDLYQPMTRVDHNFSEAHRMFVRYSHSDFFGYFDELVSGSDVRGRKRQRPHRGVAIDNVFVLNNSMVFDVRYGFTWFKEYQSFDNMGWDLKEFGFPHGPHLATGAGGRLVPANHGERHAAARQRRWLQPAHLHAHPVDGPQLDEGRAQHALRL